MKKHSKWLISTLVLAVLCLLLVYTSAERDRGIRDIGMDSSSDRRSGSLSQTTNKIESGTSHSPTNPTSTSGIGVAAGSDTIPSAQPVINCRYYVENDFMASVSVAEKDNIGTGGSQDSLVGNKTGRIAGGIVPHHLLAGKLIASFFKTLSETSLETLIIIAPNHRRYGRNSLNTSLLDWSTPFGVVKTDTATVNKLVSRMNASLSNDLLEKEHSISSLVPYIKYYMPDVKIATFLVHGNYTAGDASKLGEMLSEELSASKNTVLIASIDFSHYLDAATADKMDERTLKAIQAFDLRSISLMGNDNLDSPPSIITLLSAMKEIKADALEVTGHDNSAYISGKEYNYTTSYYTIFYRRPAQGRCNE